MFFPPFFSFSIMLFGALSNMFFRHISDYYFSIVFFHFPGDLFFRPFFQTSLVPSLPALPTLIYIHLIYMQLIKSEHHGALLPSTWDAVGRWLRGSAGHVPLEGALPWSAACLGAWFAWERAVPFGGVQYWYWYWSSTLTLRLMITIMIMISAKY